jgi:hypothetical protein
MLRTSRPVITAGSIARHEQVDPYDTFAPLSPSEETPLPMDPEFRDACYNLMGDFSKKWFFGTEFFSTSDKWTKIFRVDFAYPEWNPSAGEWQLSTLINRVVCSQKEGEEEINIAMAFGQKIAPLPPQ